MRWLVGFTGTVPPKYRQIELVTNPNVEHRRPKDIASGLFAYDSCEFRVLFDGKKIERADIVVNSASPRTTGWASCGSS